MAEVPRAFVWRDEPSGKELLMAWHNYGYGGGHSGRGGKWGHYEPQDPGSGNAPSASGPDLCQSSPPAGQTCNSTITVPGFGHALALFVQDDNAGPPTRAQVEHYFEAVHKMVSSPYIHKCSIHSLSPSYASGMCCETQRCVSVHSSRRPLPSFPRPMRLFLTSSTRSGTPYL